MIRAKNILFFAIEFPAIFGLKRDEDQQEQQSGPPSVDDPNEWKLFWKQNRNKQKGE